MKTEEIEKLFQELRRGFETGAIGEEEFQARVDRFIYQDDEGHRWTIGASTEQWFRHDNVGWVQASPPPTLEPFAEKSTPTAAEEEPPAPSPRRDRRKRVIVGVFGALLLPLVFVVALLFYQLGQSSVTAIPTQPRTPTVAGAAEVPSPETTVPSAPDATAPVVASDETATPSPSVVQPQPTVTLAPAPTSPPLPTATPMPIPDEKYGPPILVAPEYGAEFGRRYKAILVWEPVGELDEKEYYHIEICWNGCNDPGDFFGWYLRDTQYICPEYLRRYAIDERYHWHVTVRAQTGAARQGPSDPPISSPSETLVFKLTKD
jgi:hypothetical protein